MKLLIKVLHWIFFCQGKYEEAHIVLRFLRNGSVRLGLDDASWNVEQELEKLGCVITYSRNYNVATAYLRRLEA